MLSHQHAATLIARGAITPVSEVSPEQLDDTPLSKPDTQEELINRITGAIRSLPADTELYTDSDKPKVSAIETVLGFEISADDRDTAWNIVSSEQE